MKTKKIVITGGPGTGKTSVIKNLEEKGQVCLHEISRQVTLEAQRKGISQLFLKDPLLFSELLLEGRIRQYKEAGMMGSETVFLDRGIPDVVAYMDYFGNEYPSIFGEACKDYGYDMVFILPPWEEIYIPDNERYESYHQAVDIHRHLARAYKNCGYTTIELPKETLENRTAFILEKIS